jgi:acyl phosphate:glycerol-3-phosphate acyltransferase
MVGDLRSAPRGGNPCGVPPSLQVGSKRGTTEIVLPRLAFVQRVLALALAYAIGSVDFGVIVPRIMGTDIYEEGSGNPGASNVLRTLGKRAGAAVLLGDELKGVVAAAIGELWIGGGFGLVTGFAAVLGHVLPVWHRFRGGRGVATALGVALFMEPLVGICLSVVWILIVLVWKTASVASLVAMALYVPGFVVAGWRGFDLLWAAAIALLVVVRHAPNIRRLITGAENPVTS